MTGTTTDKRTLKKVQGRNRANLNKIQRVVKVVFPICPQECKDDYGYGWAAKCEHNPYYGAEGEPNLRQIAFEMKVNSQTGLDRAYLRGAKLPEDMGLKPFCQYRDCWSQDVRHKTRWGDFCSREHAALVILREEEQVVWANFDEDMKRRREQIANVSLS